MLQRQNHHSTNSSRSRLCCSHMGSSGGSGVSALTSSSRPGRRQHHQPGSGGQAAAPRQQQQQQQQRGKAVVARAMGDFFKDLFDLNSWAPKSTRVWRLQQYKPPGSEDEDGQEGAGQGSGSSSSGSGSGSPLGSADSLDVLQARISALRDSQGSSPLSSRGGSSSSASSSATAEYDGFLDADDALQPASMASFSDAEDADVAQALNARIRTIATTTGEWGSSQEEEEMRQPLSGEEIRRLLLKKYGKQYDCSFVRRNLPGMGPCVSLNIMWLHLEQASFKMTPAQYADKLESVAALVNILGQTDKVRAFLNAPARSSKGLPRRPVVGTAISIRLQLTPAQISEWFGAGYD